MKKQAYNIAKRSKKVKVKREVVKMRISDIIAEYIKSEMTDNGLEIRRSDLANKFGCVPSQINYVISTRFTAENGFIVESQRGGGGYIRIRRLKLDKNSYLMNLIHSVGDAIKQQEAYHYIGALSDNDIISRREAELMISALSDITLAPAGEIRDLVRANILKNMLIKLM